MCANPSHMLQLVVLPPAGCVRGALIMFTRLISTMITIFQLGLQTSAFPVEGVNVSQA